MSLAVDLKKTVDINMLRLAPALVHGANPQEKVGADSRLYGATSSATSIEYAFPEAIRAGNIVGVNVRSANLSSFAEHSQRSLSLRGEGKECTWTIDESLKSRVWMNMMVFSQLSYIVNPEDVIQGLAFQPASEMSDYFTVGLSEVLYK